MKVTTGTVFYVGTEQEVRHHARPLMQRMPICIEVPETVIKRANPGDVAIFYSEHFTRFRTAIDHLKSRGVATLYAIDGILEWRNAWENRPDEVACPWTMRPVLCHKVACIGASQARTLSTWGNSEKIEVVGVPRFDHLSIESETRDRPGSVIRILIMTAKCPGFTHTQRQLIKQSLVDLKEWFAREELRDSGRFEVNWRLTANLDGELGIKNELSDTTGEDLATALQRVDATITTPSTAQLESMLLGKPTAILDYTNSPLYASTAWRITSANQIESVINHLCDPPEVRMHLQNCELKDSLQLDSDATDRMIMLIEKMGEWATLMAGQNKPLLFPETLLPPIAGQQEQLCLQKAFPGIDAFKTSDMLTLQSMLADSQRANDALLSTIDDLRSEVRRAHETFDSIQKHPIAGPVIRTRQRLLDWFAKARTNTADSN